MKNLVKLAQKLGKFIKISFKKIQNCLVVGWTLVVVKPTRFLIVRTPKCAMEYFVQLGWLNGVDLSRWTKVELAFRVTLDEVLLKRRRTSPNLLQVHV